MLLADEVGLGKTLSLATAALTLCLLADKESGVRRPVVIFAPATLTEQWQTEMLDKLGIPTARWDTVGKVWLDADEWVLSPSGREQIARCPLRIGIVSTGLMMRDSLEKQHLLGLRFGVVILDEAHKARTRQGFGKAAGTSNELLAFMREIAACAYRRAAWSAACNTSSDSARVGGSAANPSSTSAGIARKPIRP